VLALNGPGVGGGAAWLPGIADIVLAAESAYLQVPFSALGLVPEFGSATSFYHQMGAHRANDFLMFGRKLTIQELEQWGVVNRVFPTQGFHEKVVQFLEEQLSVNDGKSMMEAKRLQNLPLRRDRMLAVYDAAEALAERFVEDAPKQRFAEKNKLLMGEFDASLMPTMALTTSRKVQVAVKIVKLACKINRSIFVSCIEQYSHGQSLSSLNSVLDWVPAT
jgi:Delta3-Delta2-enoyl-CoA isomerase